MTPQFRSPAPQGLAALTQGLPLGLPANPGFSVGGSVTCSLCGKIYINELLLQEHIEKCKKKKFICTVCGMRCLYPGDLRKHMKTHQK